MITKKTARQPARRKSRRHATRQSECKRELSGLLTLVTGVLLLTVLLTDAAFSARPQPPALQRDIHLVEGNEFLDPYVPALRTSNDGRIAIEVEKGTLDFYLMTPEKVNAPLYTSTPGTGLILSNQSPYRVTHHPYGNAYYGHQTVCETTSAFPSSGADANPYLCGANGKNDCYDLTHIGWVYTGTEAPIRLWGTPVTVEVSNPKTSQATIVDVRVGDSVSGPEMAGPTFWEIAVTSDGRLISGRMDNYELSFVNARTGSSHTGNYQMIYSLLEDDAQACDVREWKRFFPIAHAPYDPRVKGKYGFAAFPFRTGEGEYVSETTNFGGTYPWLDREGNNLFMTTLDEQLTDHASAYPNRCVPGTSCLVQDNRDHLKGDAMIGLWTQGKQIHFDNLLNNTDWGLPLNPNGHRLVTMYEQADGTPVEIRAGTGGRTKHRDYPNLPGRTNNTAIMDSIQSLFNHDPELTPRTPRDVVWHMSNGKATDELVFDDYLNPDGFIVSNMMASLSTHYPVYNNGFSRNSGFTNDVHLQNAATALPDRWRTPAFGLVDQGTGRVEPIALGGIHGRGFWLDGSNAIRYDVPDQPRDPSTSDWYVSLFIDSRFGNDSQRRNLISYPDGTALAVEGRSHLLFMRNNTVLERVALPLNLPLAGWAHIGLNLSDRNRNISILHNGYAFQDIRINSGFFNITAGDLIVGGSGGFKGWIDDFKVFAQTANPEVACNHAAGTLIGIDGNASWNNISSRYPQASHDSINQLVNASGRQSYARYACYTNYNDPMGIDVNNPPANTVSIREAINFPEGPIVHNKPRPDSATNEFCLSCHHVDGPGGLGLDALTLNASLNATDDPRRQPTQHLRLVHGNIPAGWLEGRIETASQAGPEGFLLDPILLTRERPNNSTPVATILISPEGTASDSPTYSWQAVSSSTWYYLWVNDATGTPIKKWYEAAAANCANGNGTCSVTPSTAVTGDVTWWVRTWNNNGSGPWSSAMQFSIVPEQATLISPNGTGNTTNPTYVWNAVAGSSWYYLWVNDSTGNIIKNWVTKADAGCSSGTGTCSFNPGTTVNGGSTWWIRTWNKSGPGPWSAPMTFTP